ncbi:Hypothetical protein PP7435_CHR3-0775 [Komagataella phaffii CBS 7435]|uniref:Uncharacterized protein n=1 Tax=Komagataella phaffii (strain ATCC 76273 / CBS 7435 / CECT 11047 / NRRL Y-11430 / Wegner 21-1) TaxID=981350 RepID=F2QWF1_KOMPC|nr:Hypothetical protein BQ9382_C3-4068 [Komagataella phaffii CBS 7435]CCA39729.1 Hypothetical protein PP7435_CHR3-0775 [Komagataella phaffii CBS 7435]
MGSQKRNAKGTGNEGRECGWMLDVDRRGTGGGGRGEVDEVKRGVKRTSMDIRWRKEVTDLKSPSSSGELDMALPILRKQFRP